jgi:hypothetical protein
MKIEINVENKEANIARGAELAIDQIKQNALEGNTITELYIKNDETYFPIKQKIGQLLSEMGNQFWWLDLGGTMSYVVGKNRFCKIRIK